MVAPHRSASMDALYRNALQVWPGMTIGWLGDLAHQGEVSGHNPDDSAPLRAEQVDADNDPEVRALDFMIGPKFTAGDAQQLVRALTGGTDRDRLYYVIYNRLIYKRSNNYRPVAYTGTDPHTNHVHASGRAVDDANSADWTSVLALRQTEEKPMRYLFDSTVLEIPPERVGRIHVTDNLRFRLVAKSSQINSLMAAAGAGPVVAVGKASLPLGWTYATAVAQLCGTLDTGEFDGTLDVDEDAIEAAAEKGAGNAIDGATIHVSP